MRMGNRSGEQNSNWKNAGWHICQQCTKVFHSYVKTRCYCSVDCYNLSRPKKEKGKKKLRSIAKRACPYCDGYIHTRSAKVKTCGGKVCRAKYFIEKHGPKPKTTCRECGKEFEHSRGVVRKYCSYDCHIKSGGALRAGAARNRSVRRTGNKKDANHNDIVAAMEKCGIQVIDTSNMGGGFPDTICCVRHTTQLVEIKNPKTGYGKRGLNKLQKDFAKDWKGGPVYIVRTNEDVECLANMRLDELDSYGR